MFDLRLHAHPVVHRRQHGAWPFIGTAMGGAMFLLVIFLVDVLGYCELQGGHRASRPCRRPP